MSSHLMFELHYKTTFLRYMTSDIICYDKKISWQNMLHNKTISS